jgi:hypothetical protein
MEKIRRWESSAFFRVELYLWRFPPNVLRIKKPKGASHGLAPFSKDLFFLLPQTPLSDVLEEAFEHSGSNRILKFCNGFGLDLPNPLPSYLEDPADFFEGV